jgi:hypothetical protein
MSFSLEKQISSRLLESWREELSGTSQAHVSREFRVGPVVPDLVIVQTKNSARHVPLSTLTNIESHIIARLLLQPSSIQQLAEALYTSTQKVERVLGRLEKKSFVHMADEAVYKVPRGAFPRTARVTAIEAKLTRWKVALRQATLYRPFANLIYVALPMRSIEQNFLPIVAQCQLGGIGLIGLDAGSIEFIRTAKFYSTSSADWVWVVAKALANTSRPIKIR